MEISVVGELLIVAAVSFQGAKTAVLWRSRKQENIGEGGGGVGGDVDVQPSQRISGFV